MRLHFYHGLEPVPNTAKYRSSKVGSDCRISDRNWPESSIGQLSKAGLSDGLTSGMGDQRMCFALTLPPARGALCQFPLK